MEKVISSAAADRRRIRALLRGEVKLGSLAPAEREQSLRAAERHGLAALLAADAPELAAGAAGVRFSAIVTGTTTVRALRALEAAGIPALAIKGAAIASLAWDDPSSRPQTDVDLLVRREELQAAIEALQAAGISGEVLIAGVVKHETSLAPTELGPAMIELHHFLSDDALGDVPTSELLDRSMVVETPEGPVRTLGLEDAAVYLAVHATFHMLDRLAWLVDLAGLSRRQSVDWALAARRARTWQAQVPTAIAWHAAVDVAGARIPEPAFEALGLGSARMALATALFEAARSLEHPARRPLAAAFRLACAPSASGAVRGLLHKTRALTEKRRAKAALARR